MCCDGWELEVAEDETTGYCPDCGTSVVYLKGGDVSDCNAIFGCNYSPCICDRCGARPCDDSC